MSTTPKIISEVPVTYGEMIEVLTKLGYHQDFDGKNNRYVNEKHDSFVLLSVKSPEAILEKAYVIFRLSPFSRNLRNEIGKKNKIFFYDIGIRNSLIQQYQPIELRTDKGAIWENFIIVERLKFLQSKGLRPNQYFWRTQEQVEIDYLEDANGQLDAYEFKWQDKKTKVPTAFSKGYPDAMFSVIHTGNFEPFVM